MSLILNIDSSLQDASVTISQNGEIINCLTNTVQKDHAAFLHVAIMQLMKENDISLSALDAIACTGGPGSYTGLRVGLAAAKGLSYALSKPLITIGTLEAMAYTASAHNSDTGIFYCPMIDARRMEVYTALYNSKMQEITAPHALIIDEHSFEKELQTKKILFFGNGMQKWKNICASNNAFFSEIGDISLAISRLSFQKMNEKKFTDLHTAIPLYAKEFYNK